MLHHLPIRHCELHETLERVAIGSDTGIGEVTLRHAVIPGSIMISIEFKVVCGVVDPHIEWHHIACLVENDIVRFCIVNFHSNFGILV